ncbi:MAG: MFS transporter, partial [Thermoplasmataceae archaeon]
VVTIGLILAGLSTLLYPLISNFSEMIALRVVEGVFNGAAWSGLVKTIQLWFPIEKRSKNLGIMIAVYSWAISVDLAIGQIVSASYGWQIWARIVGIIGIIVGAFTYYAARPYGPMVGLPHIDWGDVAPTKKTDFFARSAALFRYRWMILAILSGIVVIGGANVISGFWFSDLVTLQSINPSQVEVLATVWGVAQGILILVFGPLSDRMKKRVIFVKIGMIGGFLSFLGIVMLTIFHGVNVVAVWIITISTGIPFLIAGPIFALLADRYGVQLVGMASGYFEGLGTGGGSFIFPLIVGGLSSAFNPTIAWGALSAIVFGIAVAWSLQKEYRVNRSLVDPESLKREKEMREREFNMI